MKELPLRLHGNGSCKGNFIIFFSARWHNILTHTSFSPCHPSIPPPPPSFLHSDSPASGTNFYNSSFLLISCRPPPPPPPLLNDLSLLSLSIHSFQPPPSMSISRLPSNQSDRQTDRQSNYDVMEWIFRVIQGQRVTLLTNRIMFSRSSHNQRFSLLSTFMIRMRLFNLFLFDIQRNVRLYLRFRSEESSNLLSDQIRLHHISKISAPKYHHAPWIHLWEISRNVKKV